MAKTGGPSRSHGAKGEPLAGTGSAVAHVPHPCSQCPCNTSQQPTVLAPATAALPAPTYVQMPVRDSSGEVGVGLQLLQLVAVGGSRRRGRQGLVAQPGVIREKAHSFGLMMGRQACRSSANQLAGHSFRKWPRTDSGCTCMSTRCWDGSAPVQAQTPSWPASFLPPPASWEVQTRSGGARIATPLQAAGAKGPTTSALSKSLRVHLKQQGAT